MYVRGCVGRGTMHQCAAADQIGEAVGMGNGAVGVMRIDHVGDWHCCAGSDGVRIVYSTLNPSEIRATSNTMPVR